MEISTRGHPKAISEVKIEGDWFYLAQLKCLDASCARVLANRAGGTNGDQDTVDDIINDPLST
jgi:hypothetical protein